VSVNAIVAFYSPSTALAHRADGDAKQNATLAGSPFTNTLFAPCLEPLPAGRPDRHCRGMHAAAGGTHRTAAADADADRHGRPNDRPAADRTRPRSLADLFVADEIASAPAAFAALLGRAARLLLLLRALGFLLAHRWRARRAGAGRRHRT